MYLNSVVLQSYVLNEREKKRQDNERVLQIERGFFDTLHNKRNITWRKILRQSWNNEYEFTNILSLCACVSKVHIHHDMSSKEIYEIWWNFNVFKYWIGILLGYVHKCLNLHCSPRSQMELDIPMWKANTRLKRLSFLGPKIWSKINPNK